MDDIKISICIPTYNKSETIEYTIRSVINQTYKNWELIIIDDSNNNFTELIVNRLRENDKRILYVKNERRLGLVRNWNECIKYAQYEYIYILHHDDLLMPQVLEEYCNFLVEAPHCGLIHSNCLYITLPYFRKTIGLTQTKRILPKGDEIIEKILFNNNLACSSVMVKKDCYQRLGGFDENAWVSPDWEMWARIGKYYDFGHVDIIGCAVILNNSNTHLSAIEISELYRQQEYYYKKIISFFTEEYLSKNASIYLKAKENLHKTIVNLGFHYLSILQLRTAFKYFKKVGYRNLFKLLYIIVKAILKTTIQNIFMRKLSYDYIFKTQPKIMHP